MLTTLAVSNYRSLREIVLPLGRVTVVTGPNGVGKTNLYRALSFCADMAQGRAFGRVAREGGLDSLMWAGPRPVRERTRRIRIGFATTELGYMCELGLTPPEIPPPRRPTRFELDPEVKRESVWAGDAWSRRSALIDRRYNASEVRGEDGSWRTGPCVELWESVLSIGGTKHLPELAELRAEILAWRFYDQLRTDAEAAARRVQIGSRTPAVAHDGSDFVAAIETILEIGDADRLLASLDDAFPGATMDVDAIAGGFHLRFSDPSLLLPLSQADLSDGTLRYLIWLAALYSPRPPPLAVLNEPERSLHRDLHAPLGRLITQAAQAGIESQLLVFTHSPELVDALEPADPVRIELRKNQRGTFVADQPYLARPPWRWPSR